MTTYQTLTAKEIAVIIGQSLSTAYRKIRGEQFFSELEMRAIEAALKQKKRRVKKCLKSVE